MGLVGASRARAPATRASAVDTGSRCTAARNSRSSDPASSAKGNSAWFLRCAIARSSANRTTPVTCAASSRTSSSALCWRIAASTDGGRSTAMVPPSSGAEPSLTAENSAVHQRFRPTPGTPRRWTMSSEPVPGPSPLAWRVDPRTLDASRAVCSVLQTVDCAIVRNGRSRSGPQPSWRRQRWSSRRLRSRELGPSTSAARLSVPAPRNAPHNIGARPDVECA